MSVNAPEVHLARRRYTAMAYRLVGYIFSLLITFAFAEISHAQSDRDSLHAIATDSSVPDSTRLKTWRRIIQREMRTNTPQAYEDALDMMQFAQQAGSLRYEAYASLFISDAQAMLGDVEQSIEYAKRAHALFDSAGVRNGMGGASNNLSIIYLRLGDFETSRQYSTEALEIFTELDESASVAGALLNIGFSYQAQGLPRESLTYFRRALPMFEEVNHSRGVAATSHNIGMIYEQLGEFEEALDYYLISLGIEEESGNEVGQGESLVTICGLYTIMEDYDRAISYCERGYDVFEKLGHKAGLAQAMHNFGLIEEKREFYETALSWFEQSYEMRQELGQGKKLAQSELFIGNAHLGMGNYIDAIDWCQRGLERAEALGLYSEQEDLAECLYASFKAIGNSERALQSLELQLSIQDSIGPLEISKDLQQMEFEKKQLADSLKQAQETHALEMAYQSDISSKKRARDMFLFGGLAVLLIAIGLMSRLRFVRRTNKQLGVLNKTISDTNKQLEDKNTDLAETLQELKNTQDQLIEAERQKENEILRSRISRDIHDDISSGLTKISWMTEVMRTRAAKDEGKVDINTLDKIANYSRDTVSKLGEIIWSTKPESDNVSSMLAYMRNHLNSYLEDIEINYNIDFPSELSTENINPELRRNLYLVMKESVHNAIKYSQASELAVAFKVHDNSYAMTVTDNGIGMDVDQLGEKGNGLRNMRKRMESVDGTMNIDSQPGNGTTITFEGKFY